VTPAEAFDLTTGGGAQDFARLVAACESSGLYCLIGGLAVNCYVEPVYTLDADLVVLADKLHQLTAQLQQQGFALEKHPHSINAQAPGSDLRIQFTTDERYQPFPGRSVESEVFGVRVKVACVEDIIQGKIWAWSDPRRRLSKRKKDELDLIRLAEAYPGLRSVFPASIVGQIDRG
jgi:Nucleotidyl transferase AbiEii toxin, Type IV TA system